MSYVAAGVGGLSLVSGLMSSNSAKKSQKQALALQQETLRFNKQRYADAQNQFGDVIGSMVDGAEAGVKADLQGVSDRAAGDIATAVTGSNEAILRDQQRMGINPNSGRAESQMRKTSLATALAKAGAITGARETERRTAADQTWNRRLTVGQLGMNQMNGTAAGVNNATSSMANTYSNQASQQSAQAGQMLSSAGTLIGGAFATPSAAPTPATAAPLSTGTPMSQLPAYRLPTGLNTPSKVVQQNPTMNLSLADAMNQYLVQ